MASVTSDMIDMGWEPDIDTSDEAKGKCLGSTITAAQLAAIQNGTFDDMQIGDYWILNGVKWRIIDFW